MSLLATARASFFMLAMAHCLTAQQVGNLDLTDTTTRGFTVQESGVGSGSCGGVGHSGPSRAGDHLVEARLISIDPVLLAFGDKLDFVIRLTNIGKAEVRIPWTPNASDVEIPGAKSFEYETLVPSISLQVESGTNNNDRGEWDQLLGSELYAKSNLSAGTKLLRPGEWVEIQYREPYVSYNANISELMLQNGQLRFRITGAALLIGVTRTLAPNGRSARTDSVCRTDINFRSAGEFTLTVIPKRFDP